MTFPGLKDGAMRRVTRQIGSFMTSYFKAC
jgi:hypothetical protein